MDGCVTVAVTAAGDNPPIDRYLSAFNVSVVVCRVTLEKWGLGETLKEASKAPHE